MRFIATTKLGLESVTAFQLKKMDLSDVQNADANVSFTGTYEDMARALLYLRTAERLLLEVGSFEATTFEALFAPQPHPRERQERQEHPVLRVRLPEHREEGHRGEPEGRLSHGPCPGGRGGGHRGGGAPAGQGHCGIGLLRGGPLSPGVSDLQRGRAAERDPGRWAHLAEPLLAGHALYGPHVRQRHHAHPKAREQARDEERHDRLPIFGCDIDERSVAVARRHAEKAGVEVHWEVRPVQKLKTDYEKGLLLCNPPYGERMLTGKEAADLYRDMRRIFDGLPGWNIGIISGMDNFEKVYGKRADKRRKLSNGGLPCTFYQYFPERVREI